MDVCAVHSSSSGVMIVSGWTCVLHPSEIRSQLCDTYPGLTVQDVPTHTASSSSDHDPVDLIGPTWYTLPLRTTTILRNWFLVRHPRLYIVTVLCMCVGLALLNNHIRDDVGALSILLGCVVICITGMTHGLGLSRARVVWLSKFFDTWYLLLNLEVYMYTVALEWNRTGMPWEVVVPMIVAVSVSMGSLCMLDASRHLSRSYRITTAGILFVYFLGLWFLYKVTPKSSLRSDTRDVMERDVDVGVFMATVENTRAYACINLAAYFLRVLFCLCIQRLDYHTLKDDYVMKASSVDIRSLPLFVLPDRDGTRGKRYSSPPPTFTLVMSFSDSSLPLEKNTPSSASNMQLSTLISLEGSEGNMDGVLPSDQRDDEDVKWTSAVPQQQRCNDTNPLKVSDPPIESEDARPSPPIAPVPVDGVLPTIVAIRGCIEVDSPSAAASMEHTLREQYPFLDVNYVPMEGGEYEVFVPRVVVRAFGTKAIVPGMQRIWENKLTFLPLFIGVAIGGVGSYSPQLPEKLHFDRVISLTSGVLVLSMVLFVLILSQTRRRILFVFSSFDSIHFLLNIILAEFCVLYVWSHSYPISLAITRACTASIVQPIAFIGLDATRNTSRHFKVILMSFLSIAFLLIWFLIRYQYMISDPCCSKYLYDVIEVGVFRATVGSLRMIACANVFIFYSKYALSLLIWKREFAVLRIPVEVITASVS